MAMSASPPPPPPPSPSPSPASSRAGATPSLAIDRDEVRLASPQGGRVAAAVTVTNKGTALLQGTASVRVGSAWLRVTPDTVSLAPGDSATLAIQADPALLPPGYALGELALVTNAGRGDVRVRLSVRVERVWGRLAAAAALCAVVAAIAGVALAHVTLPAARVAALPRATTPHHGPAGRTGTHTDSAPPSVDRRAALAGIGQAIADSDAVWQGALSLHSSAALASAKTGTDLARVTSEAQDLAAHGEHWDISLGHFAVVPGSLSVSADGTRGTGDAEKTERRALYGPDHPRVPYESSDATYRLRYSLVRQGGRWLVDDVSVGALIPLVAAAPFATVPQVAAHVSPEVVRIENDGAAGTDIGTGVVVYSSATGSDILTNDHVVKDHGAVKARRYLYDASSGAYAPQRIDIASNVQEDAANDLALVHIDRGNLPVATWGDVRTLQPGGQVVAIGYAEDLAGGPTVTNGAFSSLQRTSPDNPGGPTYIGHSATINPGNSGGPLTDMSGHLMGINTFTLEGTQGLYFAIPASRAAPIAANFAGTNG